MSFDFSFTRTAAFMVFFVFASGLLAILFVASWRSQKFRHVVLEQFRAVVGLPAAAVFAFLVVALFESSSGNIRFELLGIKFEGAAGPIIMWILTYLAMTLSITMVWKKD
jgi:hypothetical protein